MRTDLDTEFFDSPRPRVIAHRGASGLFPENTFEAFRAADELHAPYVELDIHMTADGQIVVVHDPDLRRISGHAGIIGQMALDELQEIDAAYNFSPEGFAGYPFRGKGVRVPTLAAVFTRFPHLRFVVEIKQTGPSLVASMLEVIDRATMRRRVLIASEHQEPIEEVRALAPRMPTNFARQDAADFFSAMPLHTHDYVPRGDALQLPPEYKSLKMITANSVAAAHRIGVEVHVWTINEESAMRAMLALGVDGIITDYPDRLTRLLNR